MAPTIHLIRHAQGYHNLSIENESIHDPDLTPLGEEQCAAVREAFPHHDKLTRLVASPLRRTLYTGILCFGGPEHLYPIVPLDVLQEVSGSPCDTGSEPSRLAEEFGDRVEVRGLSPSWTDKGPDSKFEPQLDKLMARGKEARRAIRSLLGSLDGDEHIAVVSHGCFLHFLTDDWYGIPIKNTTGWRNCEYRSYQFVDPTGDDEDAALAELPESWRRREGLQVAPTLTEQRELRSIVQKRIAPTFKAQAAKA